MMDSKGQIVLPKDLPEKANFKPNEKIAVMACEKKMGGLLRYAYES